MSVKEVLERLLHIWKEDPKKDVKKVPNCVGTCSFIGIRRKLHPVQITSSRTAYGENRLHMCSQEFVFTLSTFVPLFKHSFTSACPLLIYSLSCTVTPILTVFVYMYLQYTKKH